MEVTGTIIRHGGKTVIMGRSPWENYLTHRVGEILSYGSKQWRVTAVNRIIQGCFGIPENRMHLLELEPIDHYEMPKEHDLLAKEQNE
jgi:hypothetical protein